MSAWKRLNEKLYLNEELTPLEEAALTSEEAAEELEAKDAEIKRLTEIVELATDLINHAFELALHHTESMKKPPVFSNVSQSYCDGASAEAEIMASILRNAKKELSSILEKK